MNYNQNDPYSTHVPYLIKLLENIKGTKNPILELGCGFGSTPILHDFSEKNNVGLLTLENDINWMTQIKSKFNESHLHKYFQVYDWNESLDKVSQQEYSLIFVDQSPWEARKLSIDKLRNKCEFILLHDCDYFLVSNTIKTYGEFGDHWKEFHPQDDGFPPGPPTLICSDRNLINL